MTLLRQLLGQSNGPQLVCFTSIDIGHNFMIHSSDSWICTYLYEAVT